MTELPLIVCDVQRAGPSTGMPTKTEQADLLQVMFGRNGEAPVPVLAPQSPADCFETAIEAVPDRDQVPHAGDHLVRRLHRQRRRAVAGARHQRDPGDRPGVRHRGQRHRQGRQAGLPAVPARPARPWPGRGPSRAPRACSTASAASRRPRTPERSPTTRPTTRRWSGPAQAKIDGIVRDIPDLVVDDPAGPDGKHARVLVLGWGSTYGPIVAAVRRVRKTGRQVAYTHLRHLNPFPAQPRARSCAVLRPGDRAGDEPRPARHAAAGQVPGGRPQLFPGPRPAHLAQRAGPRPRVRDRPTGRSATA